MMECRHDENIILSFKYFVNSKDYTIEKITKKLKKNVMILYMNYMKNLRNYQM